MMSDTIERDALYYPDIEIKDPNWLKAMLLYFPHIRRIVPRDYSPVNGSSIEPFTTTKGIGNRPLLIDQGPYDGAIIAAQKKLGNRIRENENFLKERFSRSATYREYLNDPDRQYRIFTQKAETELMNTLVDLQLAWGSGNGWHSLHPKLGRSVMATIAIALANDRGLDIVTYDEEMHRSISTQEQNDVFGELMGLPHDALEFTSSNHFDELASVFMTTHLDVSKLSISQVIELQKEKKDLRTFKAQIAEIAKFIPDILNAEERRAKLEEAAAEISHEWNEYEKSLPAFAKEALSEVTKEEVLANVSASSFSSGGDVVTAIGSLAIGITVSTGVRTWKKFK